MPTVCTLTGKFVDGTGLARTGRVTFVPTVRGASPADDLILSLGTVVRVLDASGSFSVDLYRTDDASWTPTGWVWTVLEDMTGATGVTYAIELTSSAADLADLSPVVVTDPVTSYVSQTAFDAHADATTSVHGIADTSALETATGSQSKADAAQAAAETTAAGELTTHEAATTSVHGITDTAALVVTTDSRLSDARTPTAHAASHAATGDDPLASETVATVVTETTTARTIGLTDAGTVIECTNASLTSVTIPNEATVAFPDETILSVYAAGAAGVRFGRGSGVTIRNLIGTLPQYSQASFRKLEGDEWMITSVSAVSTYNPPPSPAVSHSSWWADDLSAPGVSLVLPGTSGAYASTPDADALDITGDIDISVDVALDDWTPGATSALVSNHASGGQRGYELRTAPGGVLFLIWGDGSQEFETSTAPTGLADGTRHTIRATLDVDNGASGHDVKFYVDGVQLGSTVTSSGVTSITAATNDLNVGRRSDDSLIAAGKFYGAVIKDGIDGGTVFDVDFTTQTVGATSFTATTGQTVTVNGTAEIASVTSLWAPHADDLGYGNLVQGTASKQPTYTAANAAFNGRPTVDGDGVDDTMVSVTDGSAPQPLTMIMVTRNNLATTTTVSMGSHTVGSKPRSLLRTGQKDGIFSGTVLLEPTIEAARLTVNLYYAQYDGVSSSLERNGTVIASGNAGSDGVTSTFELLSTGGAQFTPAEVAFAMVVDGYLTTTEKTTLETWVTDTYGITIA
jgi:hypothetical protein